jgi:hypothetical protein
MTFQPTTVTAQSHDVPWGTIILYVLSGVGVTVTIVLGAFRTVWGWMKEKDKALNDARELRATTAETRATRAEEREQEARTQYAKLKGEFKATAQALRETRRREETADVGHPVSIPAPSAEEEPTGRFFVDADADRAWNEDREREKEYKRLNPDTPDNELDARLDRYTRDVDSPIPPNRPLIPPCPGPKKR